MACGQRIRLLLTFFSLRLNNMPPLRCWSRSFNFPEFAGHCLNAFTSHHSCLSPWPPSAVLSFLSSSLSDDTGPPIPTLQVQKGVTYSIIHWKLPCLFVIAFSLMGLGSRHSGGLKALYRYICHVLCVSISL